MNSYSVCTCIRAQYWTEDISVDVFYLIESLHPHLSPVLQPVGQPLLPLLNLLLAEGLSESTITVRLLMDSCHQLTHGTTNITKTHQRRHLKEVSGKGKGRRGTTFLFSMVTAGCCAAFNQHASTTTNLNKSNRDIEIPIKFPLQLTRRIASSSSGPVYLKGIRWRSMSEKYSFASLEVLVPRPL